MKTDWNFVAILEREGVQCEARIFGVLRGGHAYRGSFYTFVNGIGLLSAPISEVTELRPSGVKS